MVFSLGKSSISPSSSGRTEVIRAVFSRSVTSGDADTSRSPLYMYIEQPLISVLYMPATKSEISIPVPVMPVTLWAWL